MKQKLILLLTVRQTNKHIYWSLSQYSSTLHIITNVKLLVKCRNINHTNPSHTNKTPNSKTIFKLRITWHRGTFVWLLLCKNWLNSTFSQCVSVDLIIQHGKTKRRITYIMKSLYCPALQNLPHYLFTFSSFRKTLLNMRYIFCVDLYNCQ
jgi:hypothetical protein